MRAIDVKLRRDLWRLRGQALAIAMVIACGIAAFVGAYSNYDSLDAARNRLYAEARFGDLFATVKRAPQSLADDIAGLEGVAEVDAGIAVDARLELPGVRQPVVGRFLSLPPGGGGLNRLIVTRGRVPDPLRSDEAVIGAALADVHGIVPGARIAALMNGRYTGLTIVGIGVSPDYVFAARGGGLPDERGFGVLWMGREPLERAWDLDGAFNRLSLRLASGASADDVKARVDALLARYGGTGAHPRGDQVSHRTMTQEIEQMRVMGTVLPSIFLAVAAFLVNVVVSRLIGTQREEIAALKALGYGNRQVAWFYAKLIGIVTLGGCLAGVALGTWFGSLITELYTRFFRFPWSLFRLDPVLVLGAVAFTSVAAAAGGAGAVRAAVRLAPAEAMRPPFPARFRRLPFERRLPAMPPALAMIVRNMTRHPLRVSLSTLGVAAAVAVLVSGTFWQDATDHLIALSFQIAARQDGTVGLREPADPMVIEEVRRQPGVLAAEPARSAAVIYTAGHRTYRAGVTGLPRDGTMRRLVNLDGSTVPLATAGITLTDRLAELLGVAVGDSVRAEFVEGRRAVVDLPVAALVAEPMGMNGYLPLDVLDRAIGDAPRITEVDVRLASPEVDAFVDATRDLPGVAAVSLKASALASFEEVQARNILVFTAILTGFAFVIALGVVYNDARISLSERQWELASLRVLGFTRAEVGRLLAGELAIVFAMAIPLGLAGGNALARLLIALMRHEMFAIPLVIRPWTYTYSALAVVAAGVASALLVRGRINRLDLVGVLKARE